MDKGMMGRMEIWRKRATDGGEDMNERHTRAHKYMEAE